MIAIQCDFLQNVVYLYLKKTSSLAFVKHTHVLPQSFPYYVHYETVLTLNSKYLTED